MVGDAVSSRLPESASVARDRLRQAGCHWVTTEMAVFEWLERAGTEFVPRAASLAQISLALLK